MLNIVQSPAVIETFHGKKGKSDVVLVVHVTVADAKVLEGVCPGVAGVEEAINGAEGAKSQHMHSYETLPAMTVEILERDPASPESSPAWMPVYNWREVAITSHPIVKVPSHEMQQEGGACVLIVHIPVKMTKLELSALGAIKGADVMLRMGPTQIDLEETIEPDPTTRRRKKQAPSLLA